jgi:hypothetical protein
MACLAACRSEEASRAQADLALASAAVKQLHAKHAISSRRIQMPPANPAAAAAQGGVRVSVSVLSDAEPDCRSPQDAAHVQAGNGAGQAGSSHGNAPRQEDSWQIEAAGESYCRQLYKSFLCMVRGLQRGWCQCGLLLSCQKVDA